MRYTISKKSVKPGYMQLYEQIRSDIVGGAYPTGSKLPSKRLLAEESGTSVITVEHAYAILCDEGYAESRVRSGYFVIYRSTDFTSTPGVSVRTPVPQTAIPHGAGDFPYSVLARTMRRVISDYAERLLIKSPDRGCAELREAIAEYLARSCGMRVGAGQIIIGSGAEYLYSLIVQLLGRDRLYALEDPSYVKIRRVYEANGARTELLRLGGNGIESGELRRSKAGVLHVTPFNSYPSGVTADASKRAEYLRWADERSGYIIEDNYDSELTVSRKNEDTLFSRSLSGRVIYLNTFSRTIAPSLRVGYMVIPEGMSEAFGQKLGFYSCTVPLFEQYLLAELINGGDFERHVNRVRRAKRRALK